MCEQEALFSYEDLGLREERSLDASVTVTDIKHSYYGLSWVYLNYIDESTYVVLNTNELDVDQADMACSQVPQWWRPSVNRLYIYAALHDS